MTKAFKALARAIRSEFREIARDWKIAGETGIDWYPGKGWEGK